MNNELIAQLEQAGPGLVVQRLRAMARESVLQRLETAEAAVMAGDLIGQLDTRAGALRERLPGLAEREAPEQLAVSELQNQLVDLTAARLRATLDRDDAGAIRIGEQLSAVERQIHEHNAALRTIANTRQDIATKLGNLEAARAALEPLIVV